MKLLWLIFAGLLLAGLIALLTLLSGEARPIAPDLTASTAPAVEPIRIGLIPERDVFAQRKRHQILADYIASQAGRPVELVTSNSYATVLDDFAEKRIDMAMLGSLVAVLCADRLDARIILKTELPNGKSTYHGAIVVPEGSPITSVEQLAGRSIAMVRTTTAGDLFPFYEMHRAGLLEGERSPRVVWAGTHDDAIVAMADGMVDAAAVKNLRLEAWMAANPDRRLRILSTSGEVPENSIVIRADLADTLAPQVRQVMLDMDKAPDGRSALASYGAARFVPCDISECSLIYEMVEELGDNWSRLEISGPPPRPLPR